MVNPWEPSVGDWVRLDRGRYHGDIGIVTYLDSNTTRWPVSVTVSVVPRFPGRQTEPRSRPPRELFDFDMLRSTFPSFPIIKRNAGFVFRNRVYRGGFVDIETETDQLIADPNPPLTEISNFAMHPLDFVRDAYSAALKKLRVRCDDRIEVKTGDLRGHTGRIIDIHDVGILTVRSQDSGLDFEVLLDDVERLFAVGDRIKIMDGQHEGKLGFVIALHGGFADIYDLSLLRAYPEFTAYTCDVRSFFFFFLCVFRFV